MFSRVDKKRKVAPYVPQNIKAHVHGVSRFIGKSEGEAGVRLVMAAINDFRTLNRLAPYMWRDYAHGTHAWIGHRNNKDINQLINPNGHIFERLSMRFQEEDWASIDALGFAFGKPTAHAAAALLRFAYDYPRVTQIVAPGFQPSSPFSLKRGSYQWGSSTTIRR